MHLSCLFIYIPRALSTGTCLKPCDYEQGDREPVWPSGKALGWYAEGPRFESVRLSFLFKSCGLWTLSRDFVPHNYENIKMALIAAHLNA